MFCIFRIPRGLWTSDLSASRGPAVWEPAGDRSPTRRVPRVSLRRISPRYNTPRFSPGADTAIPGRIEYRAPQLTLAPHRTGRHPPRGEEHTGPMERFREGRTLGAPGARTAAPKTWPAFRCRAEWSGICRDEAPRAKLYLAIERWGIRETLGIEGGRFGELLALSVINRCKRMLVAKTMSLLLLWAV